MLIDIKIKRVIVLITQLFRSLPPVTEIDNTVGSVFNKYPDEQCDAFCYLYVILPILSYKRFSIKTQELGNL